MERFALSAASDGDGIERIKGNISNTMLINQD